jgi:plastocyanin domain-containing protein
MNAAAAASRAFWSAVIPALALALGGGVADAKPKKVREVSVTVTKDGFQPAEIKVKAGEKVRLVVTRKVERTCATEIVFKGLKIDEPLPLDTPVSIEISATERGEQRFACPMDMIAGKVLVE